MATVTDIGTLITLPLDGRILGQGRPGRIRFLPVQRWKISLLYWSRGVKIAELQF